MQIFINGSNSDDSPLEYYIESIQPYTLSLFPSILLSAMSNLINHKYGHNEIREAIGPREQYQYNIAPPLVIPFPLIIILAIFISFCLNFSFFFLRVMGEDQDTA